MARLSHPVNRPVVVGVDDPESSDRAALWAAEEAHRTGVPLRIVHAWSVPAITAAAPFEAPAAFVDPAPFEEAAAARLDQVASELRAEMGAECPTIDTVLVDRSPAHALTAESRDASLLVVGSHERGALGRALFGSVASACARDADVPVAVVRPDAPLPGSGDVVVGLDDSAGGRAALRWAAAEAGRLGRRLVVIHARGSSTPSAAAGFVDRSLGSLAIAGARPTAVAWRLDEHDPATALVEASARASLLVVGSRTALNPIERLLGSVSRRCVLDAMCPVVVVPPRRDASELACAS